MILKFLTRPVYRSPQRQASLKSVAEDLKMFRIQDFSDEPIRKIGTTAPTSSFLLLRGGIMQTAAVAVALRHGLHHGIPQLLGL